MQGQYPGNRGVRLRRACRSAHHEVRSARLFLCAGCRTQSLICSCCDRGQIYCAGDCAARARRHALRAAGRRYQTSRPGRLAHADRTRRYRARGKKVTHHGSPELPRDDLLAPGSPWAALFVKYHSSAARWLTFFPHSTQISPQAAAVLSRVCWVGAACSRSVFEPTRVAPPDFLFSQPHPLSDVGTAPTLSFCASQLPDDIAELGCANPDRDPEEA